MQYGNLVLGRRAGQSIEIETPGGTITITVAKILDKSTSIHIHAPRDMKIRRTEIKEKTDGR